jgi:hypothetical protein
VKGKEIVGPLPVIIYRHYQNNHERKLSISRHDDPTKAWLGLPLTPAAPWCMIPSINRSITSIGMKCVWCGPFQGVVRAVPAAGQRLLPRHRRAPHAGCVVGASVRLLGVHALCMQHQVTRAWVQWIMSITTSLAVGTASLMLGAWWWFVREWCTALYTAPCHLA